MKKVLILVLLSLLYPGCLNYVQEASLYPDGSGKLFIHYWMDAPDADSEKVLEKIGIFNPDSIRKEFSSSHNNIENIEVYTDTTDSTIHAKIFMNFAHIDSLNDIKAFSESDFKMADGAAGQKVFSQFIPPIATGFGIDGSDFTVRYKYRFHGDIIQHNAQKIDGNTLTWDYTLAEIGNGKTISVTFKPYKLKETPYWIYILSGTVLLIVIIFLFRKKKD